MRHREVRERSAPKPHGVLMTSPFSASTNFAGILDLDDMNEIRLENDSSGKVLYVGKATIANAATDAFLWMIKKISYDGHGFTDRVQLPDNGVGFVYSWDDRATYFS